MVHGGGVGQLLNRVCCKDPEHASRAEPRELLPEPTHMRETAETIEVGGDDDAERGSGCHRGAQALVGGSTGVVS